ncbi:regulator of chromosome condensation 1/beta-lactamase-inhibitor protein II [Roridomyces roridus]|uniref:Regulator of chromosome condensation 1/beta-lactamase-inhibitor protein II n=1 Tax=Roridomyces roridus TaxID=1738132 RepID=A0AAD7B2T3_9AGAR|nr:regulator of chromosome condensation 1/beta-lactamase-inhibitor protein II [Roridomyces roridus]
MLISAGSNAHGQLSNGSLDDSHSFSPSSFHGFEPGVIPGKLLDLVCGANHTITLLEINDHPELWGCGDGSSGQLGPSYTREDSTIFKPLDLLLEKNGFAGYFPRLVCASWETTYIVLSSPDMPDTLISMGANDFGDLGIGAQKVPAKDFHVVHPTDRPFIVESLLAGQHHVIAKLTTPSETLVVGWGTSRHGQLGNNLATKPFLSSPEIIILPTPISSAALGHQHTVLLHSSGTLSGLGSNRKHQLQGIGECADIKGVACTWNGTFLLTHDQHILSAGQLGRETTTALAHVKFPFTNATHRLTRIACGSEHVLACFVLRDSSEVWGWGWNEHGNLGIGTTEDVCVPVRLWSGPGDVGIWAGSGTSWIAVQ